MSRPQLTVAAFSVCPAGGQRRARPVEAAGAGALKGEPVAEACGRHPEHKATGAPCDYPAWCESHQEGLELGERACPRLSSLDRLLAAGAGDQGTGGAAVAADAGGVSTKGAAVGGAELLAGYAFEAGN